MEPDTAQTVESVRSGLVGVARGESVEVTRSAVAVSASRGAVHVRQGLTGAVLAGGDASVAQGYATALVAAGDSSVKQAGTQWLLAAGDVDVEFGGALAVAASRVTMRRGFVGLLAARQATIEDGSKVLFNGSGAAAFGAALGVALALVGGIVLATRRRKR